MDTDSIRLFLKVANLQSVSAAAKDMQLSAASASARLAKLEQQTGFRLFNRTTRNVSLSTDGAAFLPHAQHLIETLDNGLNLTTGTKAKPKGLLRIAMPGSFGRMHVVPNLTGFQRQYPDIRLDLRLSDQIQDAVEGAYDLIIRNAKLADSRLVARKLAADERILVASPDYLTEYGSPSKPSDLSQHKCINLVGHQRLEFANGDTVNMPTTFMADDGEAVRLMLEQGMGIGMKSLWNASAALKSGLLVPVLRDYPLVTKSSIWALYPSGRLVAPKVRVMIDYLLKLFQPQPPW